MNRGKRINLHLEKTVRERRRQRRSETKSEREKENIASAEIVSGYCSLLYFHSKIQLLFEIRTVQFNTRNFGVCTRRLTLQFIYLFYFRPSTIWKHVKICDVSWVQYRTATNRSRDKMARSRNNEYFDKAPHHSATRFEHTEQIEIINTKQKSYKLHH